MESYFKPFRQHIIGIDARFHSIHGEQKLLYADWTASGRLYQPIEDTLLQQVYPYVANTHTDTNYTGSLMTAAYHTAMQLIKQHVGAGEDDVLISSNSGMTGVINKFQRILGFKLHENFRHKIEFTEAERPVVFCTHMEHHSNQTTWLETIADVVLIQPDQHGLVDIDHFAGLLTQYAHRPIKIAAITSCSNVTGVFTPYHTLAGMIHRAGGLCFVDFACSAPYIHINMHPENQDEYLDAIYFSPHKFLGGPGAAGALVFNKNLYKNTVPDHPGGGTVQWTDPWGFHKYVDDIEAREDGGTPAFLATIRTAKAIQLKEEMGVTAMHQREVEMVEKFWRETENIAGLHFLASNLKERLPIFSFYLDQVHYNIVVRLLNDRFGIQVRGGCSCAGTYGHYLLHLAPDVSRRIYAEIESGDQSNRPGWVRLSLHPTTTNEEISYICGALKEIAAQGETWARDYEINPQTNQVRHQLDVESTFTAQLNSIFRNTGNH